MGVDYYVSHFYGCPVGENIDREVYEERCNMGDPQPDKNGCKIVSLDNWGAGTYAVLLAETYKCVRVKDGHSTHKIPDSVGPQDTERLKQTLQELGLPFENVGWHMAVEPW